MKFPILAVLFLLGRSLFAQDDLDAQIQALAPKLAKEGASSKLAELIGTPQGLQALKEKVEFLVSWRVGRIERDAQGRFEDYLFQLQADGSLAVRPERSETVDRLKRAVARAPRIKEAFDRRLASLAARISDTLEVDKKMKAGLGDPEVRLALFHRHLGEARESDVEELLEWTLTAGLIRKGDGRLRVGGSHAQELKDRLRATGEALESVRNYEAAYRKEAEKVEDAPTRTLALGEAAVTFVLGRILREAEEGAQDRTGNLTEADPAQNVERAVTLNKDLRELLERFPAYQKTAEELRPFFEKIRSELSSDGEAERQIAELLAKDRARFLLAERILSLHEGQSAKADGVFGQIQEDWFVAAGDRLVVKAGRFVDEQKADSPEAAWNELQNCVNEFNGSRTGFEQIAERLSDPALVGLFETREATFAVNDLVQELIQGLSEKVRREAFSDFVRLYLIPAGEGYAVRPERARKIEELAKRAEDLRKEAEKPEKNP